MKLVSFLAVLGLAAASPAVQWENFKRTHTKVYKSHAEELKRFNIFKANLATIEAHNAEFLKGTHSWSLGANKFADMTNDEFRQLYLADMSAPEVGIRKNYQCPNTYSESRSTTSYPDSVDWTTTNNPQNTVAVTAVKDQGQCGSCWSFATTGTFEGAECLAGNQDCSTWTGASEQNLVDCSVKSDTDLGPYYDMGCNGGWIDNGLYYIQVNGGIDSEEDYPYTSGNGRTGSCKYDSTYNVGREKDCGAVAEGDEVALMHASADVGPIGVAIDASSIQFQLYSGGIYAPASCSSTRLDHAVLLTGYGSDSGNDYWIIKNSWGTRWGMQGYIWIARNENNMCGVATTPAYAMV